MIRFCELYRRVAQSLSLTLSCCLLIQSPALADNTALTASEIAARAVRPNALNWSGGRMRVRMVLTDAKGRKLARSLEITGRLQREASQSLVRFLDPPDVAGTAFLMLKRGEDYEQYIYLPGLKRTRRIAGREREGSFMGSDFTYADMQGVDSKLAKHTRLNDDQIGSEPCYVIESTIEPSLNFAYSKVVTWVRRNDFIALRTRFYDRAGKLAKTLYTRKIDSIGGKLVVVEARMQNDQGSHTTELFVDAVERRDDLSDSHFVPSALEHY